MKWRAMNVYLKTISVLSTITALLLAAGADYKWA